MAEMGFRTFQEMIGRVDKLKFSPDPANAKAQLLNFSNITTDALSLRPDTNIKGGSMTQDFQTEKRLVSPGK